MKRVWLLVDGDGTDGAPYEVKAVCSTRAKALELGEAMIREAPLWGPIERRIQAMYDGDADATPHVEEWAVL